MGIFHLPVAHYDVVGGLGGGLQNVFFCPALSAGFAVTVVEADHNRSMLMLDFDVGTNPLAERARFLFCFFFFNLF